MRGSRNVLKVLAGHCSCQQIINAEAYIRRCSARVIWLKWMSLLVNLSVVPLVRPCMTPRLSIKLARTPVHDEK